MNKLAMKAMESYKDEGPMPMSKGDSDGDMVSEMEAFCTAEGKKDYAAMARAFREAVRLAK